MRWLEGHREVLCRLGTSVSVTTPQLFIVSCTGRLPGHNDLNARLCLCARIFPVRVVLHWFRVFVDMPVLHHTGVCFAPLDQGIYMLFFAVSSP